MKFGLNDKAVRLIIEVLASYPKLEEARIFGSRAIDTFRDNSDIDIALWGEIDQQALGEISFKLDELPLPYKFDVQLYQDITHQPLLDHIDQHGKLLYRL